MELVVRNGRFFTIGDDGAEFFQYKRNDIIFNAEQTKQILEKGKITHGKRRGKALAEGSAFVEGNAFNQGSGFTSRKDYYTLTSNSNSNKNSNKNSNTNSNKSNTSKSNKSSDDSNKNGYEKERAALDHQYNMDYISKQEYYNKILALDKKYYSNTEKYQEEHWKIEEELYKLEQEIYEEKIENRQNEISLLEHQAEQLKRMKTDVNADEINAKLRTNRQKTIQEYKKIQEEAHATAQKYREMGYDENHELIQKCVDDWWDAEDDMADVFKEIADEAREAAEEALDLQEKAVSVAVDIIDEEIEKLEEKKKALEEANKEKEKEIELEELQQKLANARNQKNMRVYYADRGWVWESNQEDVKEAKKELDDYIKDQEIEAVEKDIEALEEYKDLISEIPDEYEKSVDRAEVLAKYGDDFAEKLLAGLNDTDRQFVNMLKNNYADAAKYVKSLEKATDKSIADLEEFKEALMKCGYTAEEAAKIIMKAVTLAGSVDNLLGLDSEELAGILNEATGEDGFTTTTTHVGGRVNGDQIITEDSNKTFYYNQKNGNLMVVDKDTGATRIYKKGDPNYKVAIDSANASTGGMATKPPEDRVNVVDKNGNVIKSNPVTGNKNNSSSGGSSSNKTANDYGKELQKAQEAYGKATTAQERAEAHEKAEAIRQEASKNGISADKVNSAADDEWKKKANQAAVGTTYAKQGLYNVDENGEELILHKPDKGRYTFLEKGDAVFTANVTQNLLKWASTTPPAFINKLSEHAKRINTPNVSVSTSTSSGDSIHIDKLTVVSQANDFEALIRDIKVKSKNR